VTAMMIFCSLLEQVPYSKLQISRAWRCLPTKCVWNFFSRAYGSQHLYATHSYCFTMSKIMLATKNPLLDIHFSERPSSDNGKYPILACKHCKWAKTNTRQALEHLDVCLGYTKLSGLSESSKRPVKRQQTLQLGYNRFRGQRSKSLILQLL
jgi:hypothetical protein